MTRIPTPRPLPRLVAFAAALAVLLAASGCDSAGGGVERQQAERFPVKQDGLWSFIDAEGRLIGQPRFDFADEMHQSRAAVRVGTLWGYADPTGELAVSPRFLVAGRFSDGLAPVQTQDGGWAYSDIAGEIVGAATWDSAEPHSETRAAVRSGFLWGYVDERGQTVVEPQFAAAGPFVGGLAPVQTADGWRYVRPSGETAFPTTFAEARAFSDVGLAPVREQGSEVWKFVGTDGQIALNTSYQDAQPFTEGYARVVSDGRTGFIGRDGAFLVPPKMAEAGPFSEGRAAVRFNRRWGYVRRDDGRTVASPVYDQARPFRGGLAQVTTGSGDETRVGYVDAEGEVVWQPSR